MLKIYQKKLSKKFLYYLLFFNNENDILHSNHINLQQININTIESTFYKIKLLRIAKIQFPEIF